MACEDSASVDCCFDGRPWHSSCLRVHRVRDVNDVEQTLRREMIAGAHSPDDVPEPLERLTLDEEPPVAKRNDLQAEVLKIPDDVLQAPVSRSRPRILGEIVPQPRRSCRARRTGSPTGFCATLNR